MKINKTQFQKGYIPWNKGKKWSQEIKEKISKSVKYYGKTQNIGDK